MRVLVCGGRDFADREFAFAMLDRAHAKNGITCIIEGGARGADRLAKEWALSRGVGLDEFPADWTTHGNRAGPIRNKEMLDKGKPKGVIAFPGGRGTDDMVRRAQEAGVKVWRPCPSPAEEERTG
jgi:hypothetical protein